MAPAAAPAPPAPGTTPDDIARLQQLGQLHEQGVLTDEEFARQKALILGADPHQPRARPPPAAPQPAVAPSTCATATILRLHRCARHPTSTSCTAAAPITGSSGIDSSDRMQDERPRLRPSEPAVERDQLLERAALLELGVVEAVDQDVGACWKPAVRRR